MTEQTLNRPAGLEKLTRRIQDYEGYDRSETRKKTDAAVRCYLISRIRTLLAELGSQFKALDGQDQQRLEDLVKSTKRKLNTIRQSLNDPTYISVNFFNFPDISDQRLRRIYDLESDMLDETLNIDEEVMSMKQDKMQKDEFEDHFLQINNFIDEINQSLFEREALILGDE